MRILLLVLLTSAHAFCHAEENFLKSSVNWLKSSLPQDTQVQFYKSKIKFNGCKHRDYELKISQPMSDDLTFEGGIAYAKGKLNWGIHNQKISLMRFSIMPRVQLNNHMSVGVGMVYQSAPEFRTSFGPNLTLPKSQMLVLNSRFQGIRENHHVEVELSNQRWDATDPTGNWFERGAADNKLSINYQANF